MDGEKRERTAECDGGGNADRAIPVHLEDHRCGHGEQGEADFQTAVKVEKTGLQRVELIFLARMMMSRMGECESGKQGESGEAQRPATA